MKYATEHLRIAEGTPIQNGIYAPIGYKSPDMKKTKPIEFTLPSALPFYRYNSKFGATSIRVPLTVSELVANIEELEQKVVEHVIANKDQFDMTGKKDEYIRGLHNPRVRYRTNAFGEVDDECAPVIYLENKEGKSMVVNANGDPATLTQSGHAYVKFTLAHAFVSSTGITVKARLVKAILTENAMAPEDVERIMAKKNTEL